MPALWKDERLRVTEVVVERIRSSQVHSLWRPELRPCQYQKWHLGCLRRTRSSCGARCGLASVANGCNCRRRGSDRNLRLALASGKTRRHVTQPVSCLPPLWLALGHRRGLAQCIQVAQAMNTKVSRGLLSKFCRLGEAPNPSIERTVTSGLRPLVTAAHVKR